MHFTPGDGGRKADVGRNTPKSASPVDESKHVYPGNIGNHNVVIACLPSGAYGNVSAATVAMQLLSSFHSIRFGLMVGRGGGVPNGNVDIRLGDIVVSQPTDTSGGVIQYDLGEMLSGSQSQRTGMLNRPPPTPPQSPADCPRCTSQKKVESLNSFLRSEPK
jgi:hypothetical protein